MLFLIVGLGNMLRNTLRTLRTHWTVKRIWWKHNENFLWTWWQHFRNSMIRENQNYWEINFQIVPKNKSKLAQPKPKTRRSCQGDLSNKIWPSLETTRNLILKIFHWSTTRGSSIFCKISELRPCRFVPRCKEEKKCGQWGFWNLSLDLLGPAPTGTGLSHWIQLLEILPY
jgi:hypothetical protein